MMNVHDISYQFRSAASRIKPGTLIKDDHFSLFEAVGALEIGDPKMDSGCLEPDESLDQEFDMTREFQPAELVWLMDEMLDREVAWLMGYPLSQTLFTSVHIERLLWPVPTSLDNSNFISGQNPQDNVLSHSILRAYCFLLVKICDYVLSMVTSQHYYEEEDFTTQLFNRELLHRFTGENIIEVATSAIQAIQSSKLESEWQSALTSRLQFRMDVLEMLVLHAAGQTPPPSFFPFMHDALKEQQESHDLGKAVDKAFSTKLQRRLASTVPPRPMVTVSMDQAWKFWHQMLDDCKDVFDIHQASHSHDLLIAYQLFAYRNPQPSTYPRAILQSFLSLDGLVAGRTEPLNFLQQDVQSFTLPASSLLPISNGTFGTLYDGNDTIAACAQNFLAKAELPFLNLYRALCLNSCRIRRTFCHALIEWDVLQGELEDVDATIQRTRTLLAPTVSHQQQPFSYSSWLYHHKLNILQLTVQMGFDQMIYAPQELAGMYWYLSNICHIHLSHLERITSCVSEEHAKMQTSNISQEGRSASVSQHKTALTSLYRQYSWVKATQLLASSLHIIFVALQRHGIYTSTRPVYSTHSLRYDIRVKPFLNLSIPEVLPADDFDAATAMSDVDTDALLDRASNMIGAAKKAWEEIAKSSWNQFPQLKASQQACCLDQEWSTDVRNCARSVIGASLCVLALKKLSGNEDAVKMTKDKIALPSPGENGRWHRWWIVPVLPSLA